MYLSEIYNSNENLHPVLKGLTVNDLCKIELSIIAAMFRSKKLFDTIVKRVREDDFTFFVTKELFKYLTSLLDGIYYFGGERQMRNIALVMQRTKKICAESIFKILNSTPCEDIEQQLIEFLHFSQERKKIISQCEVQDTCSTRVDIQDAHGFYTAQYINNIIAMVSSSYVFHLPSAFHVALEETARSLFADSKDKGSDLTMEMSEDNYKNIKAFVLTKDISKIEKIQGWLQKNKVSSHAAHHNRGYIFDTLSFSEQNKNLKNLPQEFCEVYGKLATLHLAKNQIQTIPENINLLANCLSIDLSHNVIEYLPSELFKLKALTSLSLHNNKLQKIPEEVGSLTNLESIIISNNPIVGLPSTFARLTGLRKIAIENSLIEEESLQHIALETIEYISFNDHHLPFFQRNLHRLKKIDTINIHHTHYSKDCPIIASSGLRQENTAWMEKEDYQGHGCIVLKSLAATSLVF